MIAPTEVLEGIIVPSTEETGALVVLGEGREPLDLFLDPTVREALLETVRVQVRAIPTDASTIKGRKAIASLAYRIAQTKTAIDDVGKTLVAELKDRPKKVDAGRAVIREGLQALQDETRASLDAWEAEEAKRIAETVALEEAAALARKIEDDHEFALLLDDKMTREAEDRRREAQEAQDRRDAQVRADAQAAADRAAQEALDAAARREQESKDREAQAIADKDAAEARRIQEQKDAELRQAAAVEAERLRGEKAAADEKARIEAQEAEARADVENRRTKNLEALEDLMKAENVSEVQAKAILSAIVRGKVRNVSISYGRRP